MKLGKNDPKFHPHTLRIDRYLVGAPLPPAPAFVDWIPAVQQEYAMLGNDRVGCCAVASAAHMIQTLTANASTQIIPAVSDVLAAYSAISGWNPGAPLLPDGENPTDVGCALTDVLAYWRDTGICGHKILGWGSVNRLNLVEVQQALWLFGGIYAGLALPQSAQAQVGGVWDIVADPVAGRPGSWGGHGIPWERSASQQKKCVTWGNLQSATDAFFTSYSDELYVIFTQDWMNAQSQSPSGFPFATLQADLDQLSA